MAIESVEVTIARIDERTASTAQNILELKADVREINKAVVQQEGHLSTHESQLRVLESKTADNRRLIVYIALGVILFATSITAAVLKAIGWPI